MNTTTETERLQNALAALAVEMTKVISEQINQALPHLLPVKMPADANDRFNSDRLLNKPEMAMLLQVTLRTVDNWMERGLLPYYKIGRSVRFKMGEVLRHLDQVALVSRGGIGRRR